jgi:hypothetical protein
MIDLTEIITSDQPEKRDCSLEVALKDATLDELLQQVEALDLFRRASSNLYHRVRSLFFLTALFRYHLPLRLDPKNTGQIPYEGYHHLLGRRFSEAIDCFLVDLRQKGPSDAISSALAAAYHHMSFQTLANQVRRSVRQVRGNQWMFRLGHTADHPLRLHSDLKRPEADGVSFPVLSEKTSVRMDFSHSAWSDIFFLGMDYPEGARVLNVSVDLAVKGRDPEPRPPIETYLRVIDQPILRLASLDLGTVAEITTVAEMFDFARDYTGLLKAAVIASGIVPPGLEGCGQSMSELLSVVVGPGLGLELVSKVNDIPKGSRLAVSTNLLGSLISICMRATGQVATLDGGLEENDRRIVAARAILGEWIGGSGGGWQDSGGVWPGIKLITGALAEEGDPEFGISRGRLLPRHEVLDESEVSAETRTLLQDSLVLVHGGMAQNVGPILEMVTEKYLLRSGREWQARKEAMSILDEVVAALKKGDLKEVGRITTRNFEGPLQEIIPWATNAFTDSLIRQSRAKFGDDFWGFWMLGGMAGGGMGFIFAPQVKDEAQTWLQQAMLDTKDSMQSSLPFAMDPVVYDFSINDRGSWSKLKSGEEARMPDPYYAMLVPQWLRLPSSQLTGQTRRELEKLGDRCRGSQHDQQASSLLLDRMLPHTQGGAQSKGTLQQLLESNGFDVIQHEQIQADLRSGRIGLAQNRLSNNVTIGDVKPQDVTDLRVEKPQEWKELGERVLAEGKVAVVTLAAGVGSRWTEGAGVVKALHPFCKFEGVHRNFLEVHLAKSRKASREAGVSVPHLFTTGYLTDQPIREHLHKHKNYGYEGPVYVSRGRSVGLRTIPMQRDLRFAWEEMTQQMLDEQQQKMRASVRSALLNWAQAAGEGSNYTDNVPMQCMHPVGHWYEIPNLMRSGELQKLLQERPNVDYLLLHNIDTLGASLDPALLGAHVASTACLSFEVISRRLEDRGGGLARVNGRPRLVEGLAMPGEELEFELSYYNSMTTWIHIDRLLAVFGLSRTDLNDSRKVDDAVRRLGQRLPTYITLKDVKKRWGHGQEDVFPVAQFEKLWGDMTVLPDVDCHFMVTELLRGQQLKQQSQLDGWLRDGSASYIQQLCSWS